MASVNDGRAESSAADRIDESDRRATDCDRPDRGTADRQSDPQGRTPERQKQPQGEPSDREYAKREAAERDDTNRDIADRDDPFGNPWPHRRRIHTHTDMDQRPLANADARSILESDNCAIL